MKLTTLVFTIILMLASAPCFSQKINFTQKNSTVNAVFSEIKKQTGYTFLYSDVVLVNAKNVDIVLRNASLTEALEQLFRNQPLTYKIFEKTIVVKVLASSQQPTTIEIRGVVKDTAGSILPGVSVFVKDDPKIGTVTDANGRFILDVPQDVTLVFSLVGHTPYEAKIVGSEVLSVVLLPSRSQLEDVTVVAYGTQKKISLVGAQSTVIVKDLQQPTRSLANTLAGRVAGIISVQRTGEPGNDDASLWIKGISTFDNSLSRPLVLVDGVPRSFTNVDPEDIESFSVLKDASATAVYGVRGANGVIIINTKKGSAGKPKINFRYNEGVTAFTKLPEFTDGATYMQMSNEALITRGSSARYTDAQIEATANGVDPELFPNVDWMGILFNKTGSMRKANLNISGGSDMARYYLGASFYNETGLYKTDELKKYDAQVSDKRYNLTANVNLQATKTTKIDLGIQGYLENANYPGTVQSTIFGNAFFITPTLHPYKYNDGKIGDNTTSSITNPYALLTETGFSTCFRNQIYSNLRVTQDLSFLTKGLSATGMFSFDAQTVANMLRSKTPSTYIATGRDASGNLVYQPKYVGTEFLAYTPANEARRSIYSEAALNYTRTFGSHSVTGLLLYNQSDEVNGNVSSVTGSTTSFINSLPYRFRGLAGRTTYGFRNKYFVEANFGYNGAENLLPEDRYGFFPSGGIGWVISQESFFSPLRKAIQFAKIRATHGIVGNSNITGRRFAYSATVASTTGYNFGRSFDRTLGGRDIGEYAVDVTWETSTKSNIGLDLNTLGNKLNVQVDFFREKREDIFLSRQSLPAYMGLLNNPLGNVGIIENRGIDGSMNYAVRLSNWNIRLQGNVSYNKNKVIEDDLAPWSYPWLERKGRKVNQQFGYIALGLFESDADVAASPKQTGDVRAGDIKFKDLNGDDRIDAYDQSPIGYGDIPEVVYGFGFTVGHKAVSLSALFQGVTNMDIWLTGEGLVPFQQGLTRGNLFSNINDRWTVDNPNPNAFYPRLGSGTINDNYSKSTWWIQSGRYMRLKTLQLDITLPKSWMNKAGVSNANVFLQGVNVLTFTPFKMWDVELGNGRGATYPNIATYSIGIDIGFK